MASSLLLMAKDTWDEARGQDSRLSQPSSLVLRAQRLQNMTLQLE